MVGIYSIEHEGLRLGFYNTEDGTIWYLDPEYLTDFVASLDPSLMYKPLKPTKIKHLVLPLEFVCA